jgi:rSAM/selenodomain-associated transferase 2
VNPSAGNIVNLFSSRTPATGSGNTATPMVSVVIPVTGDHERLVRLLDQLSGLPDPPDEIVVVDGGSSAGCRSVARRYHCVYVGTRAGRGHQLHAGALRASGDVLWFVQTDAELPDDGVTLIRHSHRQGCAGGFFTFCFTGPATWRKRLIARLINWRTRVGMPYADQGIFVTRSSYDSAGGFADTPLFEQVPLVRRLRQLGAFTCMPARIGVSPRRWERDGWLRRSAGNRLLALAYIAGVPPRRLARRYQPLGPLEQAEPDQGP